MISKPLCLINLTLILSLLTFTVCQGDSIKKVLVDLRALPDAFTDDKLPSRSDETNSNNKTCYSLMGCYKTIPVFALHLDPMSLETTFTIIHGDVEHEVQIEKCNNCLASNPNDCDQYPFDLQQIIDSPFRPEKRTIIIIGGYRSKGRGPWEMRLKDLWTQLDDVNVISVGWESSNSNIIYTMAAANTRPIARQLTVLLYYLAKLKGFELDDDAYLDKFYLIGHSLGAHIAGFVGSDLAGRLGRITGLDPAGPSFDDLEGQYRIDKADARFVDILHTNAGSKIFTLKHQFGSALDSGHIDLWANDGQHQPSCSNEFRGCSHRLATIYYESFLNDVLAMRRYLGDGYKPIHRLRVYPSETFEEFKEGTSFAKRCPIFALDDQDLGYADLDQCSIPVDYVSWYNDYRNELETFYGINFNLTTTTRVPNKFYFYTSAHTNDQLDHYMIKVHASKATAEGHEVTSDHGNGCSIGLEIKMANGLDNRARINNYKLIDVEDHYEVVLPFLAPSTINKYEMAKLDSQDFYIERHQSGKEVIPDGNLQFLKKAIYQVFPSSVILDGFEVDSDDDSQSKVGVKEEANGRSKRKKRGFIESIKRFFQRTNDSVEESDSDNDNNRQGDGKKTETLKVNNCELPIESFVVQPLRKFRRHLSAFYSRACSDNQTDVNVILLGDHDPSPKEYLFNEAKAVCNMPANSNSTNLKISLTTVIIGPLLVVEGEEEAKEEETLISSSSNEAAEQAESGGELNDADEDSKTQHDKATQKYWFVLTTLLLIIVLLMILVFVLTRRLSNIDKLIRGAETTTMNNANPNYSRAHSTS